MKKVAYLLTVLFAVALMSTSCEKDDPIVPDQTLEEQYPEWSDLEWVSTNGSQTEYPRIDILIIGDLVTLTELRDLRAPAGVQPFPMQYEGIELTASTITFTEPITNSGAVMRTYDILTPDDSNTVKLRYNGNTFVLD